MSLLVDGDVVEVEHVAAGVDAASVPDAAALHRVLWSRVDRAPRLATIKGVRDEEVPGPGEARALIWALRAGAEEREGSSTRVAGDDLGELGVTDAVRQSVLGFAGIGELADVNRRVPVHVAGGVERTCRHHGMAGGGLVAEVDGAIRSLHHRGVAGARRAVRWKCVDEATAVVDRDGQPGAGVHVGVAARAVGHIHNPRRTNSDVAVQRGA